MATVPSLYMLHRAAPEASTWSGVPTFYFSAGESCAGLPQTGFATKKAAETACKQLERAARETTSLGPFLGGLLPNGLNDIVKAAKAAKLPPLDLTLIGPAVGPTPGRFGGLSYGEEYFRYSDRVHEAVAAWWASVAADITPAANAKLWDKLFPDHRFYLIGRVLLGD